MYLLIRAGYQDDSRIEKGFNWLLKMRQDDGGWVATPFQTLKLSGDKITELTTVIKTPIEEHDKSKPFSHNSTGMILRAFAVHDIYRNSKEAIRASNLLKSRFFKADYYSSYKHPDNWLRFQFPFWWNNLVAAMDTLSFIGIPATDKEIEKGLNWLVDHQESSGLWRSSYSKIHKSGQKIEEQLWISLEICKILKRFYT